MKYYINWEYGIHHVNYIEVSEKDFFKIIDDLSNEFTIIKRDGKHRNDDDSWSVFLTLYCIRDYLGNLVEIGRVFK